MTAVHYSGDLRTVACGWSLRSDQYPSGELTFTQNADLVTCPRCVEAVAGQVEAALVDWSSAPVLVFGSAAAYRGWCARLSAVGSLAFRRSHRMFDRARDWVHAMGWHRVELVELEDADRGFLLSVRDRYAGLWRWHASQRSVDGRAGCDP